MRSYRRAAFLASLFLLMPAVLLIVVGILVLAFQRAAIDITFGVLILCFCAFLLAGTFQLTWTLKREADVARLQNDFLSKVSHDFRTPLTSIRMFVETLREGRLQDEVRRERVLSLLSQETERLNQLINRLLEFARFEAGKMRYDLRPVAPGDVVRGVLERFEPRTLAPGVDLSLAIESDVPRVRADQDALGEAVQNLVDNAFKYTGSEKRILVRVAREGKEVAISVADNGPGIARSEHRRIFDRFYRADNRLQRATEGSGLGLAITRHIIVAHGGRIRVESEPRNGATFILFLPAIGV